MTETIRQQILAVRDTGEANMLDTRMAMLCRLLLPSP